MKKPKQTLALFYCQNTPESGEKDRQALEEEYGGRLRLFPLPCGGRLEPLHLLRALEEFADAVYVITCPEGACRYFEGNLRARKRADVAAQSISAIRLEKERVGIVVNSKDHLKSLAELTAEIMERIKPISASPVLSTLKTKGRIEITF
jgi:coenzyme F420-reducing hydrogenase delta subunit